MPASQQLAEDWLRQRLASLLRIDPITIDPDLSLAAHGLDSLASIELQQDIEQRFAVALPLEAILSGITLNGLSHSLSRGETRPCASADEDVFTGQAPLSPQQEALWFEHHMDPTRASYNVARALRIHSPIAPAILRDALQALVDRHDSLRLAFEARDGTPFRKLCQHVEIPFAIEKTSLSEQELMARLKREASRPFDLAQPPLLRAVLFVGCTPSVLLVVVHHLVSDLRSLLQLYQELGALLERAGPGCASSLAAAAPLKLQQPRPNANQSIGRRGPLEYWLNRLAEPSPLDLPLDRPRPSRRSFRGSDFLGDHCLNSIAAVQELAKACDTSVFTVLLAIFYIFLRRWTNQTDLIVGSPLSLRRGNDSSEAVDYLINPLPLRVRVSDSLSVHDVVALTRAVVSGAVANRQLALSEIVKHLGMSRDASRVPLFNVMFTVHQTPRAAGSDIAAIAIGTPDTRVRLGPLLAQPIDLSVQACAFDLSLAVGIVGQRMVMRWEYNSDLFDESTVRSMSRSFNVLLEAALEKPRTPICRFPLLTPADGARIASDWNYTTRAYSGSLCIVDLIDRQAKICPDNPAVVFEARTVSYRELHSRANALAARLHQLGVRAETRVGILLDRSVEMVIAVVGILKSGGIFVPMDPEHPPERLAFVISDSDPLIVLTNKAYAERCAPVRTMIIEECDQLPDRFNRPNDPAQGAYMIYTSGSTGQPKGVVNTHQGLLNRLQWMQSQYQLAPTDRVVQKTPLSFDVAVWEFLWPLMVGACLVVARPKGHREPAYLRDLIERERVSTIHFVPSMLQVFLEQCEPGSLRSIKRLICSGEELTSDLALRCADRLDAELHNLYGPTEASIDVSAWHCKTPLENRPVPIGRPIANIQLYILDPRMNLVPPGMPGELYIGGVGLARCYWKRPGLTASRFVPNPFGSTEGSRLYRTGDLARFLADGTIIYLGRTDYQVKLQGMRVELGEVEAAIRSHADVRAAAVCLTGRTALEKRLVAHVVRRSGQLDQDALRRFLLQRLPVHMVPAQFEFVPELPMTLSGKLDRRALAECANGAQAKIGRLHVESDPIASLLAGIWKEVLNVNELDPNTSFLQAGGTSLQAMQVVARIQSVLGIDLALASLFEAPSFNSFVRMVNDFSAPFSSCLPPLVQRPQAEEAPLSYEQERLWVLDQLVPNNGGYNVNHSVLLTGDVEARRLRHAFDRVVARHEILRTIFQDRSGRPVQVVKQSGSWPFRTVDVSRFPFAERSRCIRAALESLAAIRFDLGQGPLVAAVLIRIGAERHVLALSMHHIVTDGLSLAPLLAEVNANYSGLLAGRDGFEPELEFQYADYAVWQRKWIDTEWLDSELAYWSARLRGMVPLNLPVDRPRPAVQTFRGFEVRVELPAPLVGALSGLGREHGATLFMTLLAAFKLLLFRYTGQPDVMVATAVANRLLPQLEPLLGFFVNTLLLRTDLSDDPPFTEAVSRVRRSSLDAYAHRHAPFEKLVEVLQPVRDLSRPPLFQVMCVFQDFPADRLNFGKFKVEPFEFDFGVCRYDIRLSFEFNGREVAAAFQFASDLFELDTGKRFAGHFRNLLETLARDPCRRLSEFPLSSPEEIDWTNRLNDTEEEFPELGLDEMFLRQAAIRPDAPAIVSNGVRLTFGQLRRRVAAVRDLLLERNVRPNTLVGVLMHKGWEQAVATLGILEAGGAYLPLDPDLPAARIEMMLRESEVNVVLTHSTLSWAGRWPQWIKPIAVDRLAESSQPPAPRPPTPRCLDDLAYVIYTSGSTGKPKGAAISHRAAANTILDINRRFRLGCDDRILALSSLSFDLSVFDLFGTLAGGGTIVLPDRAYLVDPTHWVQLIKDEQITIWNSVPALMEMLVESLAVADREELSSLRLVLLSGDWINVKLPSRIRRWMPEAQIISLGGATEASIWSVLYPINEIDPCWRSVPYGRPLTNQKVFVLDAHHKPCPIGVQGELYIGGIGLAVGYWRDETRTANSFIFHPYSGQRLYRTGDLARYLASGDIELLGRVDGQVKVGGFRVEFGDIEAAMLADPRVRGAVAQLRPGPSGNQQIVSYYVARHGASLTPADLQAHLRTILPSYMLPRAIVALNSLPLSRNGKVDRSALPAPVQECASPSHKMPRTKVENLIARALMQAMQVDTIDLQRNFFELGATSLTLVRARHVLEEELGTKVPIIEFFSYPTIELLAAHLEASLPSDAAAERGRQRARSRRASSQRRTNRGMAKPMA